MGDEERVGKILVDQAKDRTFTPFGDAVPKIQRCPIKSRKRKASARCQLRVNRAIGRPSFLLSGASRSYSPRCWNIGGK